ncbi:MAG: phage tail tube protein [Planctomycetota bacterium]|nr:phage tail tube protein [Planctomycetota bacterium]
MANYVLGMNAKIYQGAAGAALASLTEMSNVKDVTVNLEAGEADVTTRGNSGWRAKAPTLRECSIEFEMVWKPGDTGFEAVKTAYLAGTSIELAALDGGKAVSGSQGPKGSFSITAFSRKEALEEAITASVTAKLDVWAEWVKVA